MKHFRNMTTTRSSATPAKAQITDLFGWLLEKLKGSDQ